MNNAQQNWDEPSHAAKVGASPLINGDNRGVYLIAMWFLGMTILGCGVASVYLTIVGKSVPQILVMLASGSLGVISGILIKK